MATIFDVANYLLTKVDREEGDLITNLKLQKLTYYAQAWHLAIHDTPLFDGQFEAWAHGPVHRDLYNEYRDYGSEPIPFPETFDQSTLSQEEIKFLDEVWDLYGKYSALYLRNLTHKEDPWIEARGGLPEGAYCDAMINEDTMRNFYKDYLEDEE